MYESPETPQPLFDLAAQMARDAFPTPGAGVRTIEVGPFTLPLTDKQRNAMAACWALSRVNNIPIIHVRDDESNTVRLIAFPEVR